MIRNYFKSAWRDILFHRRTSLINPSGLVIGMTAAFFMLMWVKNEHSYDTYRIEIQW